LFRKRNIEIVNDGFMKVKRTPDKNGNIKETSKMMTAGGRALTNSDGTINTETLEAIRKGSALGAQMVNEAIMRQIIKERMPGVGAAKYLNEKYRSRDVSLKRETDEKGRTIDVLVIEQVNKDGTKSSFKMSLAGNRARIDVSHVSWGGYGETHSTDGIINKSSTYKTDKSGNIKAHTIENKLSFSDYYSKGTAPMDAHGVMRRDIPEHEIMMNEDEMEELRDLFADGKGRSPLQGFK
jgi:hypothetical protein